MWKTRTPGSPKLVVVSNRLPTVLEQMAGGGYRVRPGSGGLVNALAPLLERRGGRWIGWPGIAEPPARLNWREASRQSGWTFTQEPVWLPPDCVRGYYGGFSNSVLWPLCHGLANHCEFEPAYWAAYLAANHRFSQAVPANGGTIWVHDYHLIPLSSMLRSKGVTGPIGFFLHIPFPEPGLFSRLPWHREILRGLLANDLVGFQTEMDLRAFSMSVADVFGASVLERRQGKWDIHVEGRRCRAGTFPVGIDFRERDDLASRPEVVQRTNQLRQSWKGMKVLLGVDRLDYTKGIAPRMRALSRLLERRPDLRGEVQLVQVTVPSRESLPAYAALEQDLEQLAGSINARWGTLDWQPICYLFHSVDKQTLASLYAAADVAVVTPVRDGMNIVAKEYVASRADERGVLVLSEHAGAAKQLGEGALLVNPFDDEAMVAVLERALAMRPDEQRERMRTMRDQVQRADVHAWAAEFLDILHESVPRPVAMRAVVRPVVSSVRGEPARTSVGDGFSAHHP